MKANEWIQKNGIAAARDLVAASGWRNTPFIIRLKRLVQSHELVDNYACARYSGLDNAKGHLFVLAYIESYDKMHKLQKAIADVESCIVTKMDEVSS